MSSRVIAPIPKTMRAAVYHGKNDIRVETVPVPRIGANEILVRVTVCGVCPTDIKKIQHATVPPPRVFGHETAGTIVRVGALVRTFRAGDRVALHHHIPCMDCSYCRHRAFAQCEGYKRTGITAGFEPAGGGFAEYVRVMPSVFPGVVPIPPRNSFLEGAMLEPVNTVLKAVHRLDVVAGDTVLVVGQGPIGLMFTKILALRGVRVVATDLLQARLNLARKWGARWALDPGSGDYSTRLAIASGHRGLDAAVIAVPSDPAVAMAFESVRGGGKVLLFAHTRRGSESAVDLGAVCVDEKDLIGSYSSDFTLQDAVARLVFSRKLDVRPLVTHQFGLEQTPAAIDLASKPDPSSLKVIVHQQP